MPERIRRALSHTFIYADTIPERLILDNWFGLFSPEWQRRIAGPALARDLAAIGPNVGDAAAQADRAEEHEHSELLSQFADCVSISYCSWGPTPTRSRSGAPLRGASLRPLARAAGAPPAARSQKPAARDFAI